MSGGIAQLYTMADFFLFEGFLVHVEVEQGSLLTDRECGIEQGAILELCLIGILHFYDELLAVFALAVYVEDGFAVGVDVSHMLRVEIRNVLHNLFAIKQTVEKTNQQILVYCCSKNSLEAEVGQQADISFFYLYHTHFFIPLQGYVFIPLS